jgi:hypothetical protein
LKISSIGDKEEHKMPAQYSSEVLALRDRVIRGDKKLNDAWEQIRAISDEEERERQTDRWTQAAEKLCLLCEELKAKGYYDCLYIENGKKTRPCDPPDGLCCLVCPSSYPYWKCEAGEASLAELVACRTKELLRTDGWCLWKCGSLGGDVIAVVRDEGVEGVPEGYTTYTEAELAELFQRGISQATLRLVHEAKKQTGAIVVGPKREG